MNKETEQKLLDNARKILKKHIGPNNPIVMTGLFITITQGVVIPNKKIDQTRIIRELVRLLRVEGLPVVHNRRGYFVAENDAQVEREARWFRKRGLSAFRQEAALRRINVGALFVQYKLEFEALNSDHTTENTHP